MQEILQNETFISHNAIRKLADAVMHLVTKEQLRTLKKQLQFDPRKLPLTSNDLISVFRHGNPAEISRLHDRYFQLVDTFAHLILPEQLDVLRGYAAQVERQIQQTGNDCVSDGLELLLGYLLNFLDDANNR